MRKTFEDLRIWISSRIWRIKEKKDDLDTVENRLCDYIDIWSPTRLFAVADSISEFVDRGELRQVGGNLSLQDIRKSNKWPEVIELQFETSPGRTKYMISCETWRGRGGAFWRDGYVKPRNPPIP